MQVEKKHAEQVLIAFDQLINTVFGGWADETISSRAWRKRGDGRGWALLYRVIDALFFLQVAHCRSAYESEKNRLQCPPEFR